MRILGIHADHVSYKVTKKTKIAEPDPIKEDRMEDCVLLFASVEKSDEISPELTVSATVDSILVRLGRLGAKRVMLFPYAHLASDLGCPGISQWILKNIQSRLNEKGIETKRAAFGWYKEFEIKSKGHPMADFSMTICPYAGGECDSKCCQTEPVNNILS
ncbi:MAG: threonyl-tRNA synthetase editing domain-containing protein [Methanocorpusculum sp.]|nr:threonyl-tRNA synthetase editing domain-containing protein [Methanocorpusculum sp.]